MKMKENYITFYLVVSEDKYYAAVYQDEDLAKEHASFVKGGTVLRGPFGSRDSLNDLKDDLLREKELEVERLKTSIEQNEEKTKTTNTVLPSPFFAQFIKELRLVTNCSALEQSFPYRMLVLFDRTCVSLPDRQLCINDIANILKENENKYHRLSPADIVGCHPLWGIPDWLSPALGNS